jgi:hypothetical protein
MNGLAIKRRSSLGAVLAALAMVLVSGGATDAHARAPAPVVFGGLTPQQWPVMVEVSRDRRKVVRAAVGLFVTCTSGGVGYYADRYTGVPLRRGRFQASFDGDRVNHADGTYEVFEGSVKGATNASRTAMSGTWRLMLVAYDASGAETDRCDSGTVRWKAKQ